MIVEREQRIQTDGDWDTFEKIADGFNFYPPNLPLVCSTSGEIVPVHRSLGSSYWREHVEATVELEKSMNVLESLQSGQHLVFDFPTTKSTSPVPDVHWLKPQKTDVRGASSVGLMTALGKLYISGCNPTFAAVYGENQTPVSLPVYPFEKRRYWITEIAEHMEDAVTQKAEATT